MLFQQLPMLKPPPQNEPKSEGVLLPTLSRSYIVNDLLSCNGTENDNAAQERKIEELRITVEDERKGRETR